MLKEHLHRSSRYNLARVTPERRSRWRLESFEELKVDRRRLIFECFEAWYLSRCRGRRRKGSGRRQRYRWFGCVGVDIESCYPFFEWVADGVRTSCDNIFASLSEAMTDILVQLEFRWGFVVEKKATNVIPRMSLSMPRVTPRDANKPSGKREVVFVNMFASVSIHTEKSLQSRQRTR